MAKIFKILDDALGYLIKGMLVIVGAMMTGIMVFIVVSVTTRYLFNFPLKGVLEMAEFSLITIVFLGLAYVERQAALIKVDFIFSRLPTRVQKVIVPVNLFIVLGMTVLLIWQNVLMVMEIAQQGIVSPHLHIPAWPFKMMTPLGFSVFFLQVVINLAKHLKLYSKAGEAMPVTR